MSQNLFWPPFLNGIFFFQILFQKCKCIHVLLLWAKFHWEILSGKWFFKFWSRDYFRETKIRFLAAILKRNIFLPFFLLVYSCIRCIQIWCKFRTVIPTEKYLKMVGSKWTPPPLCTNGSEKYLRYLSVNYEVIFLIVPFSLAFYPIPS